MSAPSPATWRTAPAPAHVIANWRRMAWLVLGSRTSTESQRETARRFLRVHGAVAVQS